MHDFPVCSFNPPFRGCQNPINDLCVCGSLITVFITAPEISRMLITRCHIIIKNRKHRVFGCVYRCGYWGVCTCLASMNDCWVEYWASAHRGKLGQLTPGKMDENLKSENMQKKSSFLCLCYILRAIRAGRCRERRYADHIFIQKYFRSTIS